MIVIERMKGKSVRERRIEIVERKGTGHPDFMCDSIMESISLALSREYRRRFGAVLHHNIDKGFLVAGTVNKRFGGGKVVKPMELIIGDRATFRVGRARVPVEDIAIHAAQRWIRDHLRFVDPKEHLSYRVVLAPGSEELTDIFLRRGRVLGANDTSAAVGYYPLSPTEQIVYSLERHLNSEEFKKLHPETGEDIKVMGLRSEHDLTVTIAMPLIASYIRSEKEYFERKDALHREIAQYCSGFRGFGRIQVTLNALDERGRGLGGVYLSLLGTSAEDADSGQVGRGNRVNGLISMNRPMGTEAAAGKNPVSHIGKIYSVLSHKIAKTIYERIEGVKEVYVILLSSIGTPIDRPQMATAQVLLARGRDLREIAREAEEIFDRELSGIKKFCRELSEGVYPIC